MGILAMLGYDRPLVYAKPKVGVLVTGSELQPITAPLQLGMIRDTNSYMLNAKVLNAGGIPIMMGRSETMMT